MAAPEQLFLVWLLLNQERAQIYNGMGAVYAITYLRIAGWDVVVGVSGPVQLCCLHWQMPLLEQLHDHRRVMGSLPPLKQTADLCCAAVRLFVSVTILGMLESH